jgi:hypothetical protein
MGVRLAATALLLLLSPTRSGAGSSCDDIQALADQWHELADFIDDNTSDDGAIPAKARAHVRAEQKALLPRTRSLASRLALVKVKRVRGLAMQLSGILDQMEDSDARDTWEDEVRLIDRMVDVIDDSTDQCDAGRFDFKQA